MNIRPIVIGLAAALFLPLAASAGAAVFHAGLDQAGTGVELERVAPPAGSFGRNEGDGGDDHCGKGEGDRDDHCHHHKCNDGDRDDKGDKDDKNHKDCDRSPSKPR